jgi:hypothetical protein
MMRYQIPKSLKALPATTDWGSRSVGSLVGYHEKDATSTVLDDTVDRGEFGCVC